MDLGFILFIVAIVALCGGLAWHWSRRMSKQADDWSDRFGGGGGDAVEPAAPPETPSQPAKLVATSTYLNRSHHDRDVARTIAPATPDAAADSVEAQARHRAERNQIAAAEAAREAEARRRRELDEESIARQRQRRQDDDDAASAALGGIIAAEISGALNSSPSYDSGSSSTDSSSGSIDAGGGDFGGGGADNSF